MSGGKSMLELLFAEQIRTTRLPTPEREYVFHPDRKWRFDFAWPEWDWGTRKGHHIAVEIEGGTWVAGAHTRGKHFESDCEKYAEALILGWRVLRVTTDMVQDGRAIALLRRLFDS